MNNKEYWLNIDDDYVELFQKFLGYWDPLKSKIWFIWNEEKLIWRDEEDENDFHEIPLERIINNKLNCSECDFFKRKNYNFFTKHFPNYSKIEDLWFWYQYIHNNFWLLNSHFISEFYFLPSFSWKLLGEKYGTDEESRKKFYENNNNLKDILEERLKYLLWMLPKKWWKEVYLYWEDNNIKEKIDIISNIILNTDNIFEQLGEYKWQDYKSESFTVKIYAFNKNIIYISKRIQYIDDFLKSPNFKIFK